MTEHITDRLDVIEARTPMAWHADHRDRGSLREGFADQVELDDTSLDGGTPVTLRRDDLVAAWAGVLDRQAATSHLVTATSADGNHTS